VGSVEERSIVEPIRTPLASKGFSFLEAAALRVDPVKKTVLCRAADLACETSQGGSCDLHTFTVPYDVLVLAVGSVPNTFGIPGVEDNALFFKEIPDAVRFRREASERFERASLPGMTAERARELLTFVFVGAGPTGVELAAELNDLVRQDVTRLYPASLLEHVSIEIVDLQDFVLSSYDRRIAEYATAQFKRQNIKLNLCVSPRAAAACVRPRG
jgi:NADH:ubiquinone reductase (non-electrogenic)